MQRIVRTAGHVMPWTNDILPGPRELLRPGALNLIAALSEDRDCSYQAALLPGGLQSEAGLVMRFQERCCQGLSASWHSQRPTVDADMNGPMARGAALRARSGHELRESAVLHSRQVAGRPAT